MQDKLDDDSVNDRLLTQKDFDPNSVIDENREEDNSNSFIRELNRNSFSPVTAREQHIDELLAEEQSVLTKIN